MGTILDFFRGINAAVPPPAAPSPLSRPRRSDPFHGARAYDGAGMGKAGAWLTGRGDANAEVIKDLGPLRNRSRDLVRNNAWAKRAIELTQQAIVGTGIKPTVDSPRQGDEVYRLWNAWGREAYAQNRGTIYALESLIVRSWLESGEVFLRRHTRRKADMPGLPPVQIQVLEADMCPHDLDRLEANGNRTIAGIEFDPIGRRVAYHFYLTHPGATMRAMGGASWGETTRVPASEVIHLYDELRPGQVRGLPFLTPVLIALWDLGGTAEAFRTNIRAASCVAVFVQGGDPEFAPDGITTPSDTEEGFVKDSDGAIIETITVGGIGYLPPGKTIHQNSPVIATGMKEHIETGLHEVAAGLGLSFHLLNAGDLSTANFSQAKLGLIQQAMMIDQKRDLLFLPVVMDTLWGWFIDAALFANLLRDEPAIWDVRWSKPVQQAADRLDQIKAAKDEARLGVRSIPEIIESDYGRDPDDVQAEIAGDNAKRRELGIVSDGDPSQTINYGMLQPARPVTDMVEP